ncbi:MAG: site-specific DNA-methyltransferase, partial [Cetobacterium sp.]
IENKSFNVDKERIEKLKELFPNIVSDNKIDWKTLKLMLGENITEDDERYRFTWSGKSKAIREVNIPTASTLRPDKETSKNWENTENLYIEGDNLEVLKILQNSYNGKIKMIYIDPPYNTGNDFIYNDNFTLSAEETEKQEGLKDKKGVTQTIDRLTKNSKDSAKYHTNWLNMMYPRLSIARDLLTEDGVIFISIDDNEVHNLRKICDEIFGENNFEGEISWRRRHNQPNDKTKMIAKVSEYILSYSKNSKILKENETFYGLPLSEERINDYKNPDNDSNGPWSTNPWKAAIGRGGSFYTIKTPQGIEYSENWYGNNETFNKLLLENKVYWTNDGKGVPRIKIYLSETMKKGQAGIDFFTHEKFGSNQEASSEIEKLFEKKGLFSNPKPVKLLKALIKLSTKESEICLDFFSGSATFADAIMNINLEEKTKRKFIVAQIPAELNETDSDEKVAFDYLKEKKMNTNLCEIGKERIRRAGEKILADNSDKDLSNLDIGFKTFKVDSSNFNEWDMSYKAMKKAVLQSSKGEFATYKSDRNNLDLVYEIILKEGMLLTEKVEETKIKNDIIYKIADGVMYVFLGQLTNEIIEEIVEMKKEAYDELGLDNPTVILNETYLDTEIKSNAKKNFESNGILSIKTL